MRAASALLLVTACGFSGRQDLAVPADARERDAASDATTTPGCTPGFIDVCAEAPPTQALLVTTDTTIDTARDSRCIDRIQVGNPTVCVLMFTSIEVRAGATLRLVGPRAPALIASGEIRVSGAIDVASRRGASGAASSGAGCTFLATPQNGNQGAGGGAGGSFRDSGGNGGTGDQGGATRDPGLAGPPLQPPILLRGGCPGQSGGDDGANTGGNGGLPGGALYLAGASVRVEGALMAGGAGGDGGRNSGGGGGGGSGGMIVVQAPTVTITGTVLAPGGGGGEGGGAGAGAPGADGTQPTPAAGGNTAAAGGAGGAGAATAAAGPGIADAEGGGAGGGGTGFVRLLSPALSTAGATIVPAPTP